MLKVKVIKKCSSFLNRNLSYNALISKYENDFTFINDFITIQEEQSLIKTIDPYFKKKKYEGNHWDSVIIGYKEIELNTTKFNIESQEIIKSCQQRIVEHIKQPMIYLPLHGIDLNPDGYIGIVVFLYLNVFF